MQADNVVKKQLGKTRRGSRLQTGNHVGHLRKTVDKYENRIVPIRNWEIDDQVTRDAFPGSRWNRERCKFAILLMTGSLASGTEIAGRHILLNKRTYAGKIVIARQQFKSLGLSIVASKRIIVMHLHQLDA